MSLAEHDDVDAWDHLQFWFKEYEDPARPWNIAAIARMVGMAQPTVRALLRAPKDEPGYHRVGFTRDKLRMFYKIFKERGYDPKQEYKPKSRAKSKRKASGEAAAPVEQAAPGQPATS